jgi:hypothetical protein
VPEIIDDYDRESGSGFRTAIESPTKKEKDLCFEVLHIVA